MAERSGNTKILLIGLDSMEPSLLEVWGKSGDLPVLGALAERSLICGTETLAGFGNDVFWTSLTTGVNPAKHGFYFVSKLRPGTYETFTFVSDRDLHIEPFWAAAARAGKRIGVIDIPYAPLVPGLDGLQIVDWTPHLPLREPRSWPSGEITEVLKRYGEDPFHGETDARGRTAEDFIDVCDKLTARAGAKGRLSCEYLSRGGWDLFATVFGEPHDIGHTSWHQHDTVHPWYDPELAEKLGDPVKKVYQACDAEVGKLIEAAGSEATVIVLAGPGMETNYNGVYLLDDILRRLDGTSALQAGVPRSGAPQTGPVEVAKVGGAKGLYRKFVPADLRRLIRRGGAGFGLDLTMEDRSHRRFFQVPHNEISGAIRINLIGREPHGKVAPGAEYDAVCAELARDLKDIVNQETGEPMVEDVLRPREYCDGPYVEELPDLFVTWRRHTPINHVASPKIGELRADFRGMRSGDHTSYSRLLVAGSGVRPGDIGRAVDPRDLTPTIGVMLGVALPDVEGAAIAELCGAPAGA